MFNVLDYGADKTGRVLSRGSFQKAVDEAHQEGGGTVYIPAGTYLLGTVFLYDNIHIVFENGAVILGSTDLDNDFAPREHIEPPVYQDCSHTYYDHSLFVAKNCKHISITGLGRINMQGKFEDEPTVSVCEDSNNRGAKVIAFKECHDVVLSDFSIYYASDLAIFLAGCDTVRVTKLFMDTHIDGLNIDCCKDTVVSDCIIHTGDDGIVPKSSYTLGYKKATENLTITNCVITSDCTAIKFGTESNGGFKNCTVSNCTIYDTREVGFALMAVDGAEIDGITFTGITQKNVGCPFLIVLGDRRRGPKGTTLGSIKNVSVSHMYHTGPYFSWPKQRTVYFKGKDTIEPYAQPAMIVGLPERKLENIFVSDVHFEVPGGGTKEQAERIIPECPGSYPNPVAFGRLNSYGFFARHVKNIVLDNCTVETVNDDARPVITADDVEGLVQK